MAIDYPITLSTTEPNNNIGIVKIRQADEQTQTLIVEITENGQPKSYQGLQVFFCAKLGQSQGLGIIEQKLNANEMTDSKSGKLSYTMRQEDWQHLGRQTAYFSFRKMTDDHIFEQQFTTRDFYYEVTKNVYSDGITEIKKDGSTYVWTFEDLLRLLQEFMDSGRTDFEDWYNEIKDQLSEDAAGNLMILYQSLRDKTGKDTDFRDFESNLSFMRRVFNENQERAINVKWFGAKGDGLTDDGKALKQAHEYANDVGVGVIYPPGKYYIKEVDYILVKTDMDSTRATILIDESYDRTKSLYRVRGDRDIFELGDINGVEILKTTRRVPQLAGMGQILAKVENANKLMYKRFGANASAGIPQSDMLIVDNQGNLLNEVVRKFDDITKITIFPIDYKKIELQLGTIRQLGVVKSDSGDYTKRHVMIQRSNVELSINHETEVEDEDTAPYSGIVEIVQSAYVTIKDTFLQVQPGKILASGANKSSYAINLYEVCNLTVKRTYSKSLADSSLYAWGIWGGNFLKDLSVEDCALNSIDCHMGAHNVSVKNTKLIGKTLTLNGTGLLDLDNVDFYANICVTLREDYGSNWYGPIRMRDINHYPLNPENPTAAIEARPHSEHDFGYSCILGTDIEIDGYTIYDQDIEDSKIRLLRIVSFTGAELVKSYGIPDKISVKNAKTYSGLKKLVMFDASYFNYCRARKWGSFTRNGISGRNEIQPNVSIDMAADCDWYNNYESGCMLFITLNSTIGSYTESEHIFPDNFMPYIELNLKNHQNINLAPMAYPLIVNIDKSVVKRLYAGANGRAVIRVLTSEIAGASTVGGYGVISGHPQSTDFYDCTFKPVGLSNGTAVTTEPELSNYYRCLFYNNNSPDYLAINSSIFNCRLDPRCDISTLRPNMYSYYWDFGTMAYGDRAFKKIGTTAERPATNKMGNFYFDSGENKLYIYATTWGGYKEI